MSQCGCNVFCDTVLMSSIVNILYVFLMTSLFIEEYNIFRLDDPNCLDAILSELEIYL